MNVSKKLFSLAIIALGISSIDAAPAKSAQVNNQSNISMEQMQQMQELEQFLQAFVVSLMITFFQKYPKFIISLIEAYKKDASLVEQKVVSQVQRYIKEQGDQAMNSILKEVNADKDAYDMVQQIKPFIENILAHEIVKWVHITSTSKLNLSVQAA